MVRAQIYVVSRGKKDWRKRLGNPKTQWRDGYSAKSAALSWERAAKHQRGLPEEVARLVGPVEDVMLILGEHKVAMPGKGADSQNDVFVYLRNGVGPMALAVEAKVNEPFDKPLGDWLGPAPGPNKTFRITEICKLLGQTVPPPLQVGYQLFHRTASAIIEAHRFGFSQAAMIVQSYSAQDRWFNEFSDFAAWMGHNAKPDTASHSIMPDGLSLTLGWARSSLPQG